MVNNSRHFHKHTKLAIMALISTLSQCVPIYLQFHLLFISEDVNKCEIRCHLVKVIAFQGYRFYWSF